MQEPRSVSPVTAEKKRWPIEPCVNSVLQETFPLMLDTVKSVQSMNSLLTQEHVNVIFAVLEPK